MGGNKGKELAAWTTDRHPTSTSALLSELYHLREINPKAVRPNVHLYPASIYAPDDKGEGSSAIPDRRITSWKMTEHMYFNAANPFPSLARGLFTEAVDGDEMPAEALVCEGEWKEDQTRERIVARGYDKFFNVDEVDWTVWNHMEEHTKGPYYLTLKSNGCLILISALSPRHILVASKHSLGTTTEAEQADLTTSDLTNGLGSLKLGEQPEAGKKAKKDKKEQKDAGKKEEQDDVAAEREAEAHAEVGRRWVRRTLAKCGKTEADLAKRLWETNSTAVLELCDDSFEEHVIATPEYWTGLHLHGLNHNTPHFSTALPSEVSAFASEFGFIPTKYVELPTLDAVRSFTQDVAQTGSWEGDMIEGFVVRCTVADTTGPGKPPYKPGSPFFFKVKFDEPYLLYRQWREITRVMLPLLDKPSRDVEVNIWKKVRAKVKRPEVALYTDWVAEEIKKNPDLFKEYDRGVVRVREAFLQWTRGDGRRAWAVAKAGNYSLRSGGSDKPALDKSGLKKKYILVPAAVPGCGKTLIGVALSKLFDFGHTQSDDVTTKRTAPTFLKNIADLLKTKDVVYADRNNHIDKHYNELANIANEKALKNIDVRMIGIIWDVETHPYHRMLRVCSERVVKRGDNHQTLRPDLTVDAEHEAVVGKFLRNWTAPDPVLFDKLITVQVEDGPRETLQVIVDGLVRVFGIPQPSTQDIDAALAAAFTYKVTTPYHAPAVKVGKPVRYFGIAPEIDMPKTVLSILDSVTDITAKTIFDAIRATGRLTAKPHITLAHEKHVAAERETRGVPADQDSKTPGEVEALWNTCKAQAENSTSPMYQFDITLLTWDDRAMALALDHIHPKEAGSGPELIVPEDIAQFLHVTVGTANEDIPAYESRGVVKLAREGLIAGKKSGEVGEAVEGGGLVRWVMVEGIKGEGRVRGMF